MEAKPYLQQIALKREMVPSFKQYPFNIPAIQSLHALPFHADVTFIIGENGAGKSTLLEGIALALGFGIEGGTKNVQFKTHDNASQLFNYLTCTKSFSRPTDNYFLRAESFYNVASYMEELGYTDDDDKFLHQYSHGEAFMNTLADRLKGKGLYLLDEPEAALSPNRQMAALAVIDKLVKAKSQFIIATHSPILLAYPNALIYQLDGDGISQVNYEDTEHFKLTRYFLNNHKRMTGMLFSDDEAIES